MALLSDDTKKKLKVAMTTKLEEMGVQVEKELPDYVLSMISNNKDRSYIARNLSVFMGDNSRFFSDWLHNLVERIVMQQRPAPVTAVKVDENAREKAAKLDEEAKRRKRRSDTTPPSRKAEGKSPEKKAAQQRDDDSRRGRSSRNKSRRGRSRSRSRSCEPMETNQPAKHVVSTVIRRQLSPDNRRVLSSVTVKRRLPDKSSQPRPAIFSRAIKDVLEHDGFGKNNIVRVDLEASYGESPERPVTVRLDKKLDNGDYGFCKKFARKIVIEDDDDKAEPKKLSDAGKDEGSRVFHVTPVQIVDSLHNLSQSSSNIKTRCKFWPGCDREGCTYIHPTKECTTFPHCRFGADCVYIHPPCRYANLCYNNACTYTHAKIELLDKLVQEMAERKEKRSSQTTTEVPLTMCHFAGRCKSQTCEYRHPPACRYSERCKNPQCHFYHGPLGNIQQHYSWRAMA